jgi:sortase A
VSDLRQGPGHYPQTPLPGEAGNAAIAGHRTTYSAPFGDLDQLGEGDLIRITTVRGTVSYRMYDHLVVQPTDVYVLDPDPNRTATLTLTTCDPKFSAAHRLIIRAELQRPQGAAPLPAASIPAGQPPGSVPLAVEDLSGNTGSKMPVVLWGFAASLIGAAWWLLFHRYPRWTTWLVGAIAFTPVLFMLYYNVERILPANY